MGRFEVGGGTWYIGEVFCCWTVVSIGFATVARGVFVR